MQIMIILIVVLFGAAAFFTCRGVYLRNQRRGDILAEQEHASWSKAKQVEELITLYLRMVLTHGPDSQEAKAFLFGVENDQIWREKESLKVFRSMAGIINRCFRMDAKEGNVIK